MVGGGLRLLFSVEGVAIDSSPGSAWLMSDSRAVASLEGVVGFVDEPLICLSSKAADVWFDTGC